MSFNIIKQNRLILRKLVIPSLILLGLFIFYINLFIKENTKVALSENYVRTKMLLLSYNINKDYFPFGCGLGTFGSQMSLENTIIYDKYKVEKSIVGYEDERGPIYDLFIPTFTAELGIGIIIFILFFIFIGKKRTIYNNNGLSFLKYFILFIIFTIGIFAPIIMNSFGLILMTTLGLITKKNGFLKNHNLSNEHTKNSI